MKTILDLQEYVKKVNVERGFVDTTVPELFIYLNEELGEVAKEIRKLSKMHLDVSSKERSAEEIRKELGHEMADVLNAFFDLANRFDIDLEKAFWEKEDINGKRSWTKKGG